MEKQISRKIVRGPWIFICTDFKRLIGDTAYGAHQGMAMQMEHTWRIQRRMTLQMEDTMQGSPIDDAAYGAQT